MSTIKDVENYLRNRFDDVPASDLTAQRQVVERMLRYPGSLKPVYAELLEKLPAALHPAGMNITPWQHVLNVVIIYAAYWKPDHAERVLQAISDAKKKSDAIVRQARKLAELIRERKQIIHDKGLRCDTIDDPLALLEAGAKICLGNSHTPMLFNDWVKPKLDELAARFGYKYWPETSDMIDALAEIVENQQIEAGDSLTAFQIDASRKRCSDFARGLEESIRELRRDNVDIELSAGSFSALLEVLSDFSLSAGENATYVRRSRGRRRQSERE